MRFATWNLKYPDDGKESFQRLDFLNSLEWDVLALQEVSSAAWQVFSENGLTEGGFCSLEGFGVDSKKAYGVALLVQNGFSLRDPELLPGNPQIRRALAAKLYGLENPVNVLSWHAPNAASSGAEFKMKGYKAIIGWINSKKGSIVIGFDGNHWNISSELDLLNVEYEEQSSFFLENWFFGDEPPHRLRDALIDYYRNNPTIYADAVKERPQGPLAVSYIRGKTEDRFDYIFISDDFEVSNCRYDYKGAMAAGSDHALVYAELEVDSEHHLPE